jgi:hypothetical protein
MAARVFSNFASWVTVWVAAGADEDLSSVVARVAVRTRAIQARDSLPPRTVQRRRRAQLTSAARAAASWRQSCFLASRASALDAGDRTAEGPTVRRVSSTMRSSRVLAVVQPSRELNGVVVDVSG